eukprot:15348130-Ditylum_brightwellii.AAC.1
MQCCIYDMADDGAWDDSFKTVNLHPHHYASFDKWSECFQTMYRQENGWDGDGKGDSSNSEKDEEEEVASKETLEEAIRVDVEEGMNQCSNIQTKIIRQKKQINDKRNFLDMWQKWQCRMIGGKEAKFDVITGYAMQDIKGIGMKKKLAVQRLNGIDTCVLSYASALNSNDRMKQVCEANSVAMVVADIQQGRDNEKVRSKNRKR